MAEVHVVKDAEEVLGVIAVAELALSTSLLFVLLFLSVFFVAEAQKDACHKNCLATQETRSLPQSFFSCMDLCDRNINESK